MLASRTFARLTPTLTIVGGLLAHAELSRAGTSDWADGDVFLNVDDVFAYRVYDHDGAFKESIPVPSPYDGFVHGAFRGHGDLGAIVWRLGPIEAPVYHVITLDETHPHAKTQDINAESNEEVVSMAYDARDHVYVGLLGSVGSHDVHRYDAAGVHQEAYDVAWNDSSGVQSLALCADQRTLFYVANNNSGPISVKRYDLATHTQLPDFLTTTGWMYDLALLPPFDGTGGILVAASTEVRRYDASGALVQSYALPSTVQWQSVSLDPDGTSFWSVSRTIGTPPKNLYRIDIESGAIELGPIPIGFQNIFDVIVRGELVGGSLAPRFDAPSPCASSTHAYVGVPFTFMVSGSDLNDGDTVTLAVSGLPTGATMTPSLPMNANPAQSTFDWTPAANQTGEHAITYTITDFVGHERTCTLTITVEPGVPYCFGDGLDPLLTATCPCGNDGDPGHGCANSNAALGGAVLSASGATSPNTIVLACTGVNNNTLCTFLRSPNHDVQGAVFGDGIKCLTTPLLRFGQQNSGQGGNEAFSVAVPAPTELPGRTFHYALQYRNPVGGFCLPALFNASNGYTIDW